MLDKQLARLEKVGLSSAEAQIYLALVHNGAPMSASAVVTATGVPRSSVYPTLSLLVDKGLVEAEAGYGGRFSAVPAEQALPSLMVREREELAQRAQIAGELATELKTVAEATNNNADTELIQVLRDPRVIAERFERLQLEAQSRVEAFVKAPIFVREGNATQDKALRQGVRYRGLYEQAILDAPGVKPYLSKWVSAGEEARVFAGELPHKLAIFDRQSILMPLITPRGQGKTLFIRHPQLASSLGMLFDFLWERSQPLARPEANKTGNVTADSAKKQRARNGAGRSGRAVQNRQTGPQNESKKGREGTASPKASGMKEQSSR